MSISMSAITYTVFCPKKFYGVIANTSHMANWPFSFQLLFSCVNKPKRWVQDFVVHLVHFQTFYTENMHPPLEVLWNVWFTQTLENSRKLLNFISTSQGYWKLLKNAPFASLENPWKLVNFFNCSQSVSLCNWYNAHSVHCLCLI